MFTIDQILNGDYKLDQINETDYDQIWTVLRLKIDELQYSKGRNDDDWNLMRRLQEQLDNLIDVRELKTKLTCERCGKNASYNTPMIDMETNQVLCSTCAHDDTSGHLLRGIDQRSTWRGELHYDSNLEYMKNGNVVWIGRSDYGFHTKPNYGGHHVTMRHSMPSVCTWIDKGHTTFPLDIDEKLLAIQDPEQIFKLMEELANGKKFRCTTCHKTFREDGCAGRPLFAGKVCVGCWTKHLERLENERKAGHVCSMCGQPYGNCCC
jgi:transcription elongation factor Elf1